LTEKIKSKYIWAGLTIVIASLMLILLFNYQSKLSEAEQVIKNMENEMNRNKELSENRQEKLKNEIEKLKNSLAKKEELIKTFPQLQDFMFIELKAKGFKGSSKNIVQDLLNHKELIPYKGVLGGTMRMDESGIYILTDNWVLASFGDGHVFGYMLLRYTISDGRISSWKVIDSYLFGQ
jgi:hypothetical protein